MQPKMRPCSLKKSHDGIKSSTSSQVPYSNNSHSNNPFLTPCRRPRGKEAKAGFTLLRRLGFLRTQDKAIHNSRYESFCLKTTIPQFRNPQFQEPLVRIHLAAVSQLADQEKSLNEKSGTLFESFEEDRIVDVSTINSLFLNIFFKRLIIKLSDELYIGSDKRCVACKRQFINENKL
jgi:hypothetical protein